MFKIALIIFAALLTISCSSVKPAAKDDYSARGMTIAPDIKEISDKEYSRRIEKYELEARRKYRTNIRYIFNRDSTFVICAARDRMGPGNAVPALNFFVYDISKDSMVFEDSLSSGIPSWESATLIVVISELGAKSKNEPKNKVLYYYDLTSGEKIYKQ